MEDVTAVVLFDDLRDVVLVGCSSSGTVITAVAARIPDRVVSLVYLDAFVPSDGQCTRDLLSPERRPTLDSLVETEGGGWLLPRFAPPPWLTIVREMWEITNEADIEWVLPRLRPTPYRHFTDPLSLAGTDLSAIDRLYVRCPRQPAPFDTFAEAARSSRVWRYAELDAPHLPYVTHPDLVTDVLLDTASS